MTTSWWKRLGWLAAAAVLLGACGSDSKPPAESANEAAGSDADKAAKRPKGGEEKDDDATKGAVSIDERIVAMCNLPEPRFDFDSAAVSGSAAKVLDALATCFVEGNGKGKGLRLVGHADSRGETVYNFGLGQRRAGAVAQYLAKKNLGADRVATSSRGELDATGTDEEGWAKDRRVEILLAE